tara:strand:+ start:6981 stop:7523 length:543 start_codon:yes stop_codon:yes gene_type:complete
MKLLDESEVKLAIKKDKNKDYSNSSFYDIKIFKDALKLVFKCKNKRTVDIVLNNLKKELKGEINWGKQTKMIDKKEEQLVMCLHPQELIMIINIGKIVQSKYQMKPEVALVFSIGLVFAHFVFENTSMYLSIEDIYNILPNKSKSKNGEKKFKRDFFIKGTSKEIRNILFKFNKDECKNR